MRRGAGLAVVLTVALVVAVGVFVVSPIGRHRPDVDTTGPYCSVTVDGHLAELSVEQAHYAALITAIAVRRGMPARAASIALATAYQESFLYNVDYGDRDSLGLFQQRPSQGWGTKAEVQDPEHATNAFYDALDRVDHYDALDITVAAQEVQHSAYPDAYAAHEADARAVASALTGNSPAALVCHLPGRAKVGSPVQIGTEARDRFDVAWSLISPSGVSIDTRGRVQGWAVAQYLVANAASLGIATVAFDGRTWDRTGVWRPTTDATRAAVVVQPVTAT